MRDHAFLASSLAALFLLLNTNVVQATICPFGWAQFEGACYMKLADSVTFPEAADACLNAQTGGSGLLPRLASFGKNEEVVTVMGLISAIASDEFWTGLVPSNLCKWFRDARPPTLSTTVRSCSKQILLGR